jgi:hypothetical protein
VIPWIKQVGDEVGRFSVVGKVETIFADGAFTVASLGFDFQLSPEDFSALVTRGDCIRLDVRNLTLFYSPDNESLGRILTKTVLCEECGLLLTVPQIAKPFQTQLAQMVRTGSSFQDIRKLCLGPNMRLSHLALLARHVTLLQGTCRLCDCSLAGTGEVICLKCKSVNFDW